MTDSSTDATDQQEVEPVAAPGQTDKQSLSVLLIGLSEYDLTLGREILPEYRAHIDLGRVSFLSLERFRKDKDGLTGLCGIILGDWDSPLEKRTIIDDWAYKHKIRRCAVVPDFPEIPRGPKPPIQRADWLQFQVSDMLRQYGRQGPLLNMAIFIEQNLDPHQSRSDTANMMKKLYEHGYSAQVDAVRKIISDIRQRQNAEARTVRPRPAAPRWKIVYGQGDYDDLPAAESDEEID